MSTKKQRREEREKKEKISLYEFECPKVDKLSDYVAGKLKDNKEESFAIEDHVFGGDETKGCTDCFKHLASLNGASQTLIDALD